MNFRGLGVTVLEVLHRGKEYMAINQKCIDDLRSLLSVPDNFERLLT
jgi:phosphoserine aminotransferase